MGEGDVIEKQLNEAFPQDLINSAVAKECFGGEFIFKNMNFMEKMIIKKIAKTDKDVVRISDDKIERFGELMNKA